MLENFTGMKKELAELATVLNAFKSEAVQLRILEVLFGAESESREVGLHTSEKARTQVRKTKVAKREKKIPEGTTKKGRGTSGSGAVAALGQFVTGGFFSKPRTINDIIVDCKHNKARDYKANEFSGKLARLVRSGELSRKKNPDNQYEYTKNK